MRMTGAPRRTDGHEPEPDNAPAPQPGQRLSIDRRLATMTGRRTFAALQMSATIGATLGGLALYGFLLGFRVNSLLALLAGFLFALASRRAVSSLALEWVLARARQRNGERPQTPDAPRRG
jgi:hypothetical protein